MAEQKITVQLDPKQVADLKQFVRDEIRKERGEPEIVRTDPREGAAQVELGKLRTRIKEIADRIERPEYLTGIPMEGLNQLAEDLRETL